MSKNHIAGGKVSRRHTSFIDAAQSVVNFLNKNILVKKYTLGIISPGKSQHRRIKIHLIQGGIKLVIYGNTYFQEIYTYTNQPQKLTEQLNNNLKSQYIIQSKNN